jgi:hypothetical protein
MYLNGGTVYTKCLKCGKPNVDDSLPPEGYCFLCSTGDDEYTPITNGNIQDAFKNIAKTIANRVGELTSTVRKRLLAANANDRNVDRN